MSCHKAGTYGGPPNDYSVTLQLLYINKIHASPVCVTSSYTDVRDSEVLGFHKFKSTPSRHACEILLFKRALINIYPDVGCRKMSEAMGLIHFNIRHLFLRVFNICYSTPVQEPHAIIQSLWSYLYVYNSNRKCRILQKRVFACVPCCWCSRVSAVSGQTRTNLTPITIRFFCCIAPTRNPSKYAFAYSKGLSHSAILRGCANLSMTYIWPISLATGSSARRTIRLFRPRCVTSRSVRW